MKRSLIGGVIFLLSVVGALGAAVDLSKTISIKVSLSMPWSDFCLLENYFRTKLAEEVIDKNWKTVSASRIILHNLDDHCPAKDRITRVEGLVIYISEPGSKSVDVSLTRKTYKILYYVWENNLDGALGKLFRKKLTSVKAQGKEAPSEPTGTSELQKTFIGIGIACAVIAALIIVLAIVFYCRKLSNTKKDHDDEARGYRSGYANNGADNGVLEEDTADPDNSVSVTTGNGNETIKTKDEDEDSTKL